MKLSCLRRPLFDLFFGAEIAAWSLRCLWITVGWLRLPLYVRRGGSTTMPINLRRDPKNFNP